MINETNESGKIGICSNYQFFLKGYLSQWFKSYFVDKEGTIYNCCEQYMMAQKAIICRDTDTLQAILASSSPAEQKSLGRKVKGFVEDNWKVVREDVVFQGNLYKFSQNEDFKQKLLNTKDKILVEVNPKDSIWGIGLSIDDPEIYDETKWRGLNLLGNAIMKVRERLLALEETKKLNKFSINSASFVD